MDTYVLLTIAAGGLILCVANWRMGFLVCAIVGCLQDPIRKLVPGEPIVITSAILVYVAATCLGAYLKGRRFSLRPIHNWNPSLRLPLAFFFLLVIIQSGVTFVRFGSPILAAIGLLAYITPIPGILLGYQFAERETQTHKFIKVYLVLCVLMISGVYLDYAGFEWSVLRQVGEGLVFYSQATGIIILRAGFFRAPEVAAWHAATAICFLIILFMVITKHGMLKLATGGLILFFWGALLFTGRRKFIIEIFIFLCVYGGLLLFVRSKTTKLATAAFLLMIGLGVALTGYVFFAPEDLQAGLEPYYERSARVGSEANDRATGMTVESFGSVLEQNGPWGSGAGTGSQGAQHFGGGGELVGLSAEGGLSKILAELGLPGLGLILWLAIALARYFLAIIREVKKADFGRSSLTFGLIAMLVANAFVFVTAHQIFGDPFVLSLLGFLIGFVMAVPHMPPALESSGRRSALILPPSAEWNVAQSVRESGPSIGFAQKVQKPPGRAATEPEAVAPGSP